MQDNISFSKIFSASRLNVFDQCPKYYEMYYIDPKMKEAKNRLKRKFENLWPFQTIGSAVHNAITLFYHLPLEQRNTGNLSRILEKTWRNDAYPYRTQLPLLQYGGFKSLEEEREAYHLAGSLLQTFFRILPQDIDAFYLPTVNLYTLQDYLNLRTPFISDIEISGKFDLILNNDDGSITIVDFKTSKSDRSEKAVKQMNFYQLLAELRFKKPIKELMLVYLRTGRRVFVDLEEQETIAKQIEDKINLINETNDFATKPSKLCKYCIFRDLCPAKDEVRKYCDEEETSFEVAEDLPF